jgi:hypothetical protein
MINNKLYVTRDGDKIWHNQNLINDPDGGHDHYMTEHPGARNEGPALILSPAINHWRLEGLRHLKWFKRSIVKVWTCNNCHKPIRWIGQNGDFFNGCETCGCG